MVYLFHSSLSEDFSSILNDADDYDVIIQVGENSNTEFRAHSLILRARSPYFKSALSSEWVTKKNNMFMFSELDLKNHLREDIFELLVASDELNLKKLFNPIQNYLIENRETFIQENIDLILHTIDEINVWDCLIDWGIKQTPGLDSDRTKWDNEDCEALKKNFGTIFFSYSICGFSYTDYFNEIQPYKAIIPNNIYEGIEEFHIKGTLLRTITLPPRNRIETNIIKPKFISKIVNWIDRKEEDFIQVLFLTKCQITQEMFGGYTPVGLCIEDVDKDMVYYYDGCYYYPTDETMSCL
ncbi:hypothetical protein GLOIN_2v1878292 [Rhizophagus clarus]|uniref:BTB domain-containing protein n=1 Tax=Rhizophagus clarus TaxID=94130 RepID=A0A8H3QJM2_9GLOM|nr:hypothetical protein GLOIN_2v1878292 [Rhizophagus clarus]